jgi:uncharacterized protein
MVDPSRGSGLRRLVSVAWHLGLAILPLGVGLAISVALLPSTGDPSDPVTLTIRIAVGIAISSLALAVVALLSRHADRKAMSDAGLTNVRSGWRLALWGALVWLAPAAASFSVLALLGTPITVTVPTTELTQTVLLLLLAVLLTEALPEEAVFRGYVTTALGTVLHGWWLIAIQALLFTLFAGLLRQDWNPADLSLYLTMGIGFGYLRMITGSVWMSIGFHLAFQTGAQLVLTHDSVDFAGDNAAAMLALGVVPFTVAAILISTTGIPRFIDPGPREALLRR